MRKNYRLQMLPLEKVELDTLYTFTINHALEYDTVMEYERSYKREIAKFSRYCHYTLYPEFSCIGKMHYHGVIKFMNKTNLILFTLRLKALKLSIEIDTIESMDDWLEYVKKQKTLTKDFFDMHRIDYPLYNNKIMLI